MVLAGALINGLEAAVGGILGLLFKGRVSERLGDFLLKGQGLAVVLVAVQGMMRGGNVAIVTLSLALGSVIGLGIDIDARIRSLGEWAQRRLNQAFAGSKRLGNFSDGFVTASIFTCTGAMAIVGSIEDGIYGNYSILAAKAVLDLLIIMIMTASMGKGCAFSAIPVGIVQGLFTLLAVVMRPVFTEAALSNLSLVGNIMIFCVGLNLVFGKKIRVANLLPTLVFAVIWAFVPWLN